MGNDFFFYDAGPLAIDKRRPWQLCSAIGAICGKFASKDHAKVACEALREAKRSGELPCNLSEWSGAHILSDPPAMSWQFDGSGGWDALSLISDDGVHLEYKIGVCDDGTFDVSQSDPELVLADKPDCFASLTAAQDWCAGNEVVLAFKLQPK